MNTIHDLSDGETDSEYESISSPDSEYEEYEMMDIVDKEDDVTTDEEEVKETILKIRGYTQEEYDSFYWNYTIPTISEKFLLWLIHNANEAERLKVSIINRHRNGISYVYICDIGDPFNEIDPIYVSVGLPIGTPEGFYKVNKDGFTKI